MAQTAPRPAPAAADPITTEIIRNAFVSCAQDMNATLIRSSYTRPLRNPSTASVTVRRSGESFTPPTFSARGSISGQP